MDHVGKQTSISDLELGDQSESLKKSMSFVVKRVLDRKSVV